MLYRFLAESVLIVHFLFIMFGLLGGFLVIRWRRVMFFHVPAVAWGVYIWMSGNVCPLTPLEKDLRVKAGDAGYEGGFVEHYLVSIIYPDGLTRGLQFALVGILVGLNVTAYLLVWRKGRKTATPTMTAGVEPAEQ